MIFQVMISAVLIILALFGVTKVLKSSQPSTTLKMSNPLRIIDDSRYTLQFEDGLVDKDKMSYEVAKGPGHDEFDAAVKTVTATLRRCITIVAERQQLPEEDLSIQFDLWPFDGRIPVERFYYDETQLPCHQLYSVEMTELFPPEEPTEPLVQDRRACHPTWTEHTEHAVNQFLHTTLIRRAPGKNPPIAITNRIINFDHENHYLAYYFSPDDWIGGAGVQVRKLIEAGHLIMTKQKG